MPRRGAPAGHPRWGGREKGTKNRTTLEKERLAAEIAVRTVADAKSSGRKLAKEVMQDYLPVLAGMTAYYQPTFPGMAQQNPRGNPAEFERWLKHLMDLLKMLAPFESPTFKAIMIAPPPDPVSNAPKRFTLTIFEGERPAGMAEIIPPDRERASKNGSGS